MNNEEKILALLEALASDVASLKDDVSGLKADMDVIKPQIAEIKMNVEFVWQDMSRAEKRFEQHEDLPFHIRKSQ